MSRICELNRKRLMVKQHMVTYDGIRKEAYMAAYSINLYIIQSVAVDSY
jgi:hypothetical protein